MRNIITTFTRAAAVAAAGGALLLWPVTAPAGEPARPSVAVANPSTGATKGRVLILDNERTLTGDIELVRDEYRIRRLIGETRVPAAKALKLCGSLEEAYAYLRDRANLRDPDERMRLADWCRQHGLSRQALAEVEAADALKPGDPAIGRWVSHLRKVLAEGDRPRPSAEGQQEPPLLARVDVTAETLGEFAHRIQPILMNACASCHTAGRGGSFQLRRTYGNSLTDRRSLDHNLAMTLSQLSSQGPRNSRLLVKALSRHGAGMAQAPLKGREAPAYRHLEAWVLRAVENNPHLNDRLAVAEPGPTTLPPPTPPSMGWGQDRKPKGSPAVPVAAAPPALTSPKPATPPKEPPDPLGPDAFNREFHPERKPAPGGGGTQ